MTEKQCPIDFDKKFAEVKDRFMSSLKREPPEISGTFLVNKEGIPGMALQVDKDGTWEVRAMQRGVNTKKDPSFSQALFLYAQTIDRNFPMNFERIGQESPKDFMDRVERVREEYVQKNKE